MARISHPYLLARLLLFFSILALLFSGTGSGGYQAAHALVCANNDDFDCAYQVDVVPYESTQSDIPLATTAPDDPTLPCIGGVKYHSVWFKYLATANEKLSFSTYGSDYDSILAVWSGSRGSLVNEACVDDTPTSLRAQLQVNMVNGRTYYIEVASFNPDITAGTLKLIVFRSNTDVLIGGTLAGAYALLPGVSIRETFTSVDDGPVKIISTGGPSIIASMRINMPTNNTYSSYAEMMAIPSSKLSDTYIFPWYNNASNGGVRSQIRFANLGTQSTTVTVTIGSTFTRSYLLLPNQSRREMYAGIDAGPVVVKSTDGVPIIASMRINLRDIPQTAGYSSYSEFMGLSASDVKGTKFIFPWYNNATAGGVQTQLRFGNVGNSQTTVKVTIGDTLRGSYILNPSESRRESYPNLDRGPVIVESTGGVPIIAAIRINLKTLPAYSSYSEFMGQPGETLTDTKYILPWYNNAANGGLRSQLRIANVGGITTQLKITIGGAQQGGLISLGANREVRVSFPDVDNGPVVIESLDAAPIVASIGINLRKILQTVEYSSYTELMGLSSGAPLGLPGNEVSTTYWFPVYNNVGVSSQLRFGIP